MESPVKHVLRANTTELRRKENIRIKADRQKKLFYSVLPHELPGELAVPPEDPAQAAAIPNPAVPRRKNSCRSYAESMDRNIDDSADKHSFWDLLLFDDR